VIPLWKAKEEKQEQGKGSAVKSPGLIAGWKTKNLLF
jgi:hypothetical protein